MAGSLLAAAGDAAELDGVGADADVTYGYGRVASSSMQALLEFVPSLEATLSPSVSFSASARVRLDAFDDLEPGEPAFDTYADASRMLTLGDAGAAEIRDFYVEFRNRHGLTRLGRQQIVWGRLDGIKVLDVVNPQEFREFILDDFNQSRIGLWSAYLDYSIGDWRAELAVVPDATAHAIPVEGAWFELRAPRFRFGATPDQPGLPVTTVRPGHSIDETGAGLRLSRQVGNTELAMLAYTGMDPEPLGRILATGGTPQLERYYRRRDVAGFSVDTGLGRAVLRAEYAYQPSRVFNLRAPDGLDTVELDQHRGAIGLDVDGPLGVFINVQYLVDTIRDAPGALVRPARDRVATLFVRKAFGYDRLILEARWYHSLTDRDDLTSLGVDYALNDSTSIRFAAEQFRGTPAGLFGQFADRDRITLGIRHTF